MACDPDRIARLDELRRTPAEEGIRDVVDEVHPTPGHEDAEPFLSSAESAIDWE